MLKDKIDRPFIRFETNHKEDTLPVSLTHLIVDPGAGPHTFEIRWRVEDDFAEQFGATWGAGRSFTVMELSN